MKQQPAVPDAAALARLLAPTAPHDDLPFEELAQRYNYRLTSSRQGVFARLILKQLNAATAPKRILDIGCGAGFSRNNAYQYALKPHVDEYWGIEPDESVAPAPALFTNFQHALMETAILPANHFDVAFASFVVEHVAQPIEFLTAVHRCLKPGGVLLFITPNGKHYFTRIANLMRALKLDEFTLRTVIGSKQVESYHYPVQYKMNHERHLIRYARQLNFEPPEFAFLEQIGPKAYLPGPLRLVFHAFALKRKLIHNPRCLLDMICRMRKPAT